MNADTGTRSELRAWWMRACSIPLSGEVYRSHPQGHAYPYRDIWHVRKVRKNKVPPFVLIDVYMVTIASVTHGKCHKNVELPLADWQRMFNDGELQFVSYDIHAVLRAPW